MGTTDGSEITFLDELQEKINKLSSKSLLTENLTIYDAATMEKDQVHGDDGGKGDMKSCMKSGMKTTSAEEGQPRLHFLVVDDDGASRRSIRRMLAGQGQEVTEVSSGSDGLKTFEAFKNRGVFFDVILMEEDMEGAMSGSETARMLRVNGCHAAIFTLTTSGGDSSHSSVQDSAASNGCTAASEGSICKSTATITSTNVDEAESDQSETGVGAKVVDVEVQVTSMKSSDVNAVLRKPLCLNQLKQHIYEHFRSGANSSGKKLSAKVLSKAPHQG
jgi:CheY-like chemotaxis protein